MPRGYRGIYAALGGLILAGAHPAPQQPAEGEGDQAHSPISHGQPAILWSAPPVDAVKSPEKEGPCGPNRYRSEDDLCAQWKAADAARDAADYAYLSLWLGVVGTIGLLITLYYTRKAVLAAEDATKDADTAIAIAERNAAATAGLVEVSERSSRVELRAYLDFDGVRIDLWPDYNGDSDDEVGARFSVTVRNYGKTPAENVELRVRVFIKHADKDEVVPISHEDTKSFNAVAPGDFSHYRSFWHLPRNFVKALIDTSVVCHTAIFVTYTDVFGTPHVLRCEFQGLGIKEDFGFVDGTRCST
jgi:hypothetical protein